jgi:Tfp pilus assembly PilM family ATPase
MKLLSLLRMPPLQVAVEISARHVVAVSVTGRGGALRTAGHAVERLPDGAVVPSLNAANIAAPVEVSAALTRAFASLGTRPRRVGLVVPDPVAKVSLVKFANVPSRASDFDEMVRFQVRKAAPFKPEDAVVSYTPGAAGEGGHEFVVLQARRDIIKEYEDVCERAGAAAGLVDLATFNVLNAVMATTQKLSRDWLLVYVATEYAAIAIMRDQDLVFFRNRGTDGDGQLTDLVHQTAMYYQDRLGGSGFGRVVLADADTDASDSELRRSIETRLGVPVESIDPTLAAPLPDRLSPSRDLVHRLTPAMGLVLSQNAGR